MIEITDKEIENFWKLFDARPTGTREAEKDATKAALTDFLNNRPAPVATLRPIAEMPEKVPEGCVRMYWAADKGRWSAPQGASVTHATDIQLPTAPDPEADLRREFEEAMKKHRQWAPASFFFKNGRYESPSTESHFDIYKLAKGAKP